MACALIKIVVDRGMQLDSAIENGLREQAKHDGGGFLFAYVNLDNKNIRISAISFTPLPFPLKCYPSKRSPNETRLINRMLEKTKTTGHFPVSQRAPELLESSAMH